MKIKKRISLIVILMSAAFLPGCGDCYDADLKASYQGVACTQDCPGVCGCDGKFYCNGCIAAKEGIAVEQGETCN